jgi:hypothetical protein
LLLLSLSANAAGVIAEVLNEGGGSIALTDIKCTTIKDTFIAYSYLPNGKSVLGCWAYDESRVFVRWSDGDIRSYDINVFNIPKKTGKWL